MGTWRITGGQSYNLGSSLSDRTSALNGGSGGGTTEVERQTRIYGAGYSASELFVNVGANDYNGTSTFKLRVNAADSALTLNIGASLTGQFEDTSHTVSLADADLLNHKLVVGGTPSAGIALRAYAISLVNATLGPILGCMLNVTSLAANLVRALTISGYGNPETTATLADYTLRTAQTFSNGRVYVSANTDAVSDTMTLVKTSVNTTLVVTLTASTTGAFADTTHSVAFAAGDKVRWVLSGGGMSTASRTVDQAQLTTTSAANILITYESNVVATNYAPPGGLIATNTVESATKVKARGNGYTARNLFVQITQNTSSANPTVTLRQNGASSALIITVSGTGIIEDTTHTVTVVAADDINIGQIVGGVTGSVFLYAGLELLPTTPKALPLFQRPWRYWNRRAA